jgi:hypothetical protein
MSDDKNYPVWPDDVHAEQEKQNKTPAPKPKEKKESWAA